MLCVIDFETSGLPPKGVRVNNNTYKQFPRAVQFCCIEYDEETKQEISRQTYLFKIDDFIIPQESIAIHKITNEMVQETGVYFEDVYESILEKLSSAKKVIGHNLAFDLNILRTELFHLFHDNIVMLNQTIGTIDSLNTYCTLQNTIQFCGIKAVSCTGREYIKYPTLTELYKRLFDKTPEIQMHSADADCEICLECFLKLQEVMI